MKEQIQTSFARYEKKYRLRADQQQTLLQQMRPYLTPDRYSSYTLCNLYYDTADWQLIRTCLEKPVYKEKLRVRSYGVPSDGDRVFLEIKKKYAGIVYKRRITAAVQDAAGLLAQDLPVRAAGQIGAEIAQFQARYRAQPRVFLAYDRQAFSGAQDTGLRVTFDTNLRWRQTELDLRLGDHGAPLLPPDDVLLESKLPGACPLWLSHLLSAQGIFPASFSKYGACYRQKLAKEALRCA